jgi:pimeloyl-ACP methyl ester carboxylesterase
VAAAVRTLHESRPGIRIHLVGHSLGGRLMAACAKALCDPPKVQPDSLTLLEAAFSHFGFSPDNGHGNAGFFRDVVAKHIVKGPFVSTFSAQDTVVGKAFDARLAGDYTGGVFAPPSDDRHRRPKRRLKTAEVASSRPHSPGTVQITRSGSSTTSTDRAG